MATPRRRAVTIVEVVVTLTILAVISTVVVSSISSRTGGAIERVDRAAFVLSKLADATVRFSNANYNAAQRGFSQQVGGTNPGGVNPGRLSQLTNAITQTDVNNITNKNSCGGNYTAGQVALWTNTTNGGPFYPRPVTTGGFKIAEGFVADDTLSRYDPAGVVTKVPSGGVNEFSTPGTLAIVLQGVPIEDAEALLLATEGDQSGTAGSVRFTRNGTRPVTVYYHMAIHGC